MLVLMGVVVNLMVISGVMILGESGMKKTSFVLLAVVTFMVCFGIPEEYRSRDISEMID